MSMYHGRRDRRTTGEVAEPKADELREEELRAEELRGEEPTEPRGEEPNFLCNLLQNRVQ